MRALKEVMLVLSIALLVVCYVFTDINGNPGTDDASGNIDASEVVRLR